VTELRFNELRGEEVVYAAHRQDRTLLPGPEDCPLCPGSAEIPRESFEIAVFENRFPAFAASEVVVYTDSHVGSFGTLAPERANALMWVWRDRYRELGAHPGVDYVLIFENRGIQVGATLDHPHGQIYGYPFVPPVPAAERRADERRGGCTPCALAAGELDAGERVVYRNGSLVAYVPYAARWPYELHVGFVEHRPSLLECSPAELQDLADALQRVARGYDALWDRALPYMMVVHQAPTDGGGDGHLHVEFYTPLRAPDTPKHVSCGEHGAGTFTVDVLPERAASELRAAIERAG
jgi:UDPglucose--hexose-1-phosphate uridylyltransferase